MTAGTKFGLLVVAIAVVALIGSLVAYRLFLREQLRPATADEVAARVQGDWIGTSVNNVHEILEGTIKIRRLGGNRLEGEEDWRG